MTTAAAAAAGAAALTTVKTASDLVDKIKCGVGLAIEIENWTKFPLNKPEVRFYKGYSGHAAGVVQPGSRDAMTLLKGNGCKGTFGTVSWLLELGSSSHGDCPKEDRRVVVLWYMPFNFNHYSNRLAVGITKPGNVIHAPGHAWYDYMANDKKEGIEYEFDYDRREYYYEQKTVEVSDDRFRVEGVCGTTHVTTAKITVIPTNNEDLAPDITAKMGINDS